MANSYTQLQDIKSRIVSQLSGQQTQLTTATGAFTAIKTTLAAFQATYAPWAIEVDAMLAASPADEALIALAAEKDLLVAEFASTKVEAEALETAVAGV